MAARRVDLRTLAIMLVATILGAVWATYNRGLTSPPYAEEELRPLVWVIFATPFALLLGWCVARWHEAWWAAFVCFCLYFFSPFVAQRYESCTVVRNSFQFGDCFAATAEARQLAETSGHRIYFEVVVLIHVVLALVIIVHRALASGQPSGRSAPNSSNEHSRAGVPS